MGNQTKASSNSRAQAFQKDLCSCVSMCIKNTRRMNSSKNILWRIVKMRCIRKSKKETQGESAKHDSSKSMSKGHMLVHVAVHWTKRKEFTKDILWRFVKCDLDANVKGNTVCADMLKTNRRMNSKKDIPWRLLKVNMRFIRQRKGKH